jgi:translocation and assembly module TamB
LTWLALFPWIGVALLLALLMAADSNAGRDLLARALSAATGGQILVHGIGGELPFRPRVERLELRDADGEWLRANDLALVLRPISLLRGELDIGALTADQLELARLPQTDTGGGARFHLPVSVRLQRLVIARLTSTLLGTDLPPLTVTGSVRLGGADADADLLLTAPGQRDRYCLTLATRSQGHRLSVAAIGAADGPLSALARSAGLPLPPELAGWTLNARAEGPLAAVGLDAEIASGPYRASARGVIDLSANSISALGLHLEVGPMAVQPAGIQRALTWEAIAANAELAGPLRSPRATVRASAREVEVGPVALAQDDAGSASGPRMSSSDAGGRGASGQGRPGQSGGPASTSAALFAGDLQLEGHFDLAGPSRVSVTVAATPSQVLEPWGALLGDALRLSLAAKRGADVWAIESGRLEAGLFDLDLAGQLGSRLLDLSWALRLEAPKLPGSIAGVMLDAQGRASGTPMQPNLDVDLRLRRISVAAAVPADPTVPHRSTAAATGDAAGGQVQGSLVLKPMAPRGRLSLGGEWRGEPVAVELAVEPMSDGGLELRLGDSRWGGVTLAGSLQRAAGARLPRGGLRLGIARLDAVAPLLVSLLGDRLPLDPAKHWLSRVGGRLDARLELAGDERIRLTADGTALRFPPELRLGALALQGSLHDPFGAARTEVQLRATELTAPGIAGQLELRARGPLDACDIDADAQLRIARSGASGEDDVRLAAEGRLGLLARRLALSTLSVDARGGRLTLLAPAAVDFSAGLTLESVRLGLSSDRNADLTAGPDARAGGELELTGQVAPRLSLDARLAGLDLGAAAPLLASTPWTPEGVIEAEARLTGSAAAPTGRLSLRADGLGFAHAERLGLPRADGRLTLTLEPSSARLVAEAWIEDRARLALDGLIGGAVWSASAPLQLRGNGRLDLSVLDAWLGAGGRGAGGHVRLEVDVTGRRDAPHLDGGFSIADGAWRDRRLGLWLEGIAGDARLRGDRLHIARLVAKAGTGTLELDGGIGWMEPGQPVDLRLRARGAEPIRLDLLRLRGDADLALRGALQEDLRLSGAMRLDEVDIRIPERMPADVPTLDVVERGERRQPRPAARPTAGRTRPDRLQVDVRVDAPRAVLVRGRNIDAELGGEVRLQGSAAALAAEGGFALLRGEYQLIGQPLRFSRGRIGLDTVDLLDPTLDFEARAQSPGATAILAVEGRARAPRLILRGEPPMSDDEVLSRLLFGVPPARLSAFQLTRVGLAATSIAGLDGDGSGLLTGVRRGLGLERLRMDSDRRGDAVIEGGRNLGERVYLGARQGMSGGEPRAVLGVRLAPRIRFESDVGAGGAGAAAAFEIDY